MFTKISFFEAMKVMTTSVEARSVVDKSVVVRCVDDLNVDGI